MDAWRYGIYLLVFTFDIERVRYQCEHEKINSISTRAYVLFSILYIHISIVMGYNYDYMAGRLYGGLS